MAVETQASLPKKFESHRRAFRRLRWSGIGLVSASWLSAAIFGIYILTFYLGAIPGRDFESWNNNLPGLYEKGNYVALLSMAAHLAAGGIVLLLGPVPLIDGFRRRWPALHRSFGRIYVLTAFIAGLGRSGLHPESRDRWWISNERRGLVFTAC